MADEVLHCVTIEAVAADGPLLQEMLAALEIDNQSMWLSAELDRCVSRVYCEDAVAAKSMATRLQEALEFWQPLLTGGAPVFGVGELKREDWAECWKKYFHTFQASKRLVVKPSWEAYSASPGEVVLEIDPGMSFGTGQHGTTQACLQFLDDLAAELGPVSFLDAGCGSGILSMGALKLGYRPVVAFDYDPQAVEIARENLERAGCQDVQLCQADVAEFVAQQPFRVVVANILATVLLDNAEGLVALLDRDSRPSYLILSGILIEQYGDLKARFQALGLEEVRSTVIKEWQSGVFVLA